MTDTLSSSTNFGGLDNFLAAFGLSTISDNHGNRTSGRTLHCANGKDFFLGFSDWNDLHTVIGAFKGLQLVAIRHGNEMPGDMGSPLRWMCQHHGSAQLEQSRQ